MRTETLTVEYVETMPEKLREGVLYVSQRYGVAIHLCACGCGYETVTPFNHEAGWELSFNGGATLHPSIGNQNFPCKSHYWIKAGRVVWC